jgi:succinate dehydrogenase/fumarate reductase flavoprotein subunit
MARSRKHVVPSDQVSWDAAYDVVVVGAGAGGFSSGLVAASNGSSVAIVEKGSEPGGTMKKSAAWYWVPNNSYMAADGKPDDKQAFLQYVARLGRPQSYDPNHPTYGLSEWEHAACEALFENAAKANDYLAEIGAIRPLYSPAIPDYHSTLQEARIPFGRTLQIDRGDGEMGKGDVLTAQLLAACEKQDVSIRVDHRVEAVVVDGDGAVVGVRASSNGSTVHLQARQGVVFATGGFTHNPELRKNFLQAPIFSGCAAPTNEGDFVTIATALGLPLRNMNYAWMAPIPLEIALSGSPYLSGMFAVPGDSMIWMDKCGNRVVNEKGVYNELAMTFFEYDAWKMEYSRLLMFMVWDQRTMDLWRAEGSPKERLSLDNYGNVVYDDYHLMRGETWQELSAQIQSRVEKLAPHTGGFRLDPAFHMNLPGSVARFNELAATGKDVDFHRGENPIELIFNGEAKPDNDTGNPTMYPISETGPYYATIVCAGTLDTKGGPVTNPNGQVLDADGQPVPGLYGVGNCVANASAQAYWAGGATIGPYFTFGYLAGQHVAGQTRR